MPRKKKIDPNEKRRKNFRLPHGLTMWAEQYAKSKNTNLTQLIVDQLTELREQQSE